MASKTPKSRGGTSPTKSRRGVNTHANNVDQSEYVLLDKELIRGVSEKEVEIEHLKTTVAALQEKVSVLEDLKQDVSTHKSLLQNSESKREALQTHITETSITIRTDTEQHATYQQSLIDEIEKLKGEVQRLLKQQAQTEEDCLVKMDNSNKQFSNTIDQMTSEHNQTVQQMNQEHQQKIEKLMNEHHQKIQEMNKEFNEKFEAQKKESQEKYDQLFKEKEALRQEKDAQILNLTREKESQREEYERRINELDIQIKQHQKTILTLNSTIIELKQIITQKSDVEDQLTKAREQLAQIDGQKMQLQKELETASDYILDLEEKVYKANKTSLELLRQLKDAEVEIETLKNYIIELKQRIAVYIPVKDDAIDKKLAEFINNYPERQKLKIMFMRESEGVYQFGTKRVAVRVDKDKINIRVGGGYLSIDEFLDQYTPVELEKLERKDPLKKFSEKVAVQKTIVGKELRESSPVRGGFSPDRKSHQSPQKRF